MACLILWAASTFAKVAVAPITRTVLALLQSRTERVKKTTQTRTPTPEQEAMASSGVLQKCEGIRKKTNKIQKKYLRLTAPKHN